MSKEKPTHTQERRVMSEEVGVVETPAVRLGDI
jgi:hypothetical protein